MARLNIGCGDQILGGWINVDLYNDKADIKADVLSLPFEDGSIDEILAQHVLEHVSYHKTMVALGEWHRVLAPKGVLLVHVPDMSFLCTELIKSHDYFSDIIRAMYGSQTDPGQIHYTGFTFNTLEQCLELAGFENIQRMPTDHSHHLCVRANKRGAK